MHEYKIMQDIMEKAGEAKEITVIVGEISGIHTHDLKNLEKEYKVNFEIEEGEVECSCGYKGKPKILMNEHEHVIIECPSCGEIPKIIKGENVILKDICV
jgi:Zn finger protein HypA/HybF involved in hydrogenase expression